MDTSLRSLLSTNNLKMGSVFKPQGPSFCSDQFKQFLTTDEELLASKDYQKIFNLLENFWNLGIIQRGSGFCLSVSDTLNKVLKANGISSNLVECELIITTDSPPSINMVGQDYNPVTSDLQINCHVVCVTNTKIPMLIDISIADYGETTGVPFVLERLSPAEEADLSLIKYKKASYFYSKKLTSILPDMHQKSILDRINTDKKIFSDISKVYLILYILVGISSINFIRGSYDFYQKYINQDNNFGPTKVKN